MVRHLVQGGAVGQRADLAVQVFHGPVLANSASPSTLIMFDQEVHSRGRRADARGTKGGKPNEGGHTSTSR